MQVSGSAPSRGPVARWLCPGGHLTFMPPLCFLPRTTSAGVARRPMSELLVSELRSQAAVLSGSRARHSQTLVLGGTQFLSGLVVAVTEGEAQATWGPAASPPRLRSCVHTGAPCPLPARLSFWCSLVNAYYLLRGHPVQDLPGRVTVPLLDHSASSSYRHGTAVKCLRVFV